MFLQLTKYLLHYREMNIPEIGAFKLVQVPACLDVVNKVIHPPGFTVQFSDHDYVKEHQISYLASTLDGNKNTARQELEQFGELLKNLLYKGSFVWKGLGTLELTQNVVNFHPSLQLGQVLAPVPAERVFRDRNQLNVVVGDKVINTGQEVVEEEEGKKRSPAMIIGWVLIFLSLAFIAYHFYKNGLEPSSTGNQMKIKVEKSK